MEEVLAARAVEHFDLLGERVAEARPEEGLGAVHDDGRVDEAVGGAGLAEVVAVQRAVLLVEHGDGGDRRAVGGDGRAGHDGLAHHVSRSLDGVAAAAAAHGEDHVGIPDAGAGLDRLDVGDRGVMTVDVDVRDGEAGRLERGQKGGIGLRHGRFAADDRNAGAVGSNDVANKAVGFGTDGIVREADGVVRLHDEILFFFLQGLCGFDAVFFKRRKIHCHAESGRRDPTNALVVLRIVREASKKMREGHGRAIRVWRRRLQNKKKREVRSANLPLVRLH